MCLRIEIGLKVANIENCPIDITEGSVSFSESDGRCCQHHAGQAGDFEAEGSPSKGLLLFEWFERQISRPLLVWKFQTFEVSYDFQRHLRIWGWDKRTRTRLRTWVGHAWSGLGQRHTIFEASHSDTDKLRTRVSTHLWEAHCFLKTLW